MDSFFHSYFVSSNPTKTFLQIFSFIFIKHQKHGGKKTHQTQKLSTIIEESTNDVENGIDLKMLLDSLKALLWHFQCPLCSNELNETCISSECLHRFCRDCILKTQATSMAVSISTCVHASAKHNAIYTKCPFCKETTEQNTKFLPDKQFEAIVSEFLFAHLYLFKWNIEMNQYDNMILCMYLRALYK